ncbi:MAG: hypothetical protein CMJ18_03465 [Phycisphaeraceae bacterium]|nr:hypothetical protein [Phycisphaeraceae bacterium]
MIDASTSFFAEAASIGIDVALKATFVYLAAMATATATALSKRCALCTSTFWHACLVGLIVLPVASALLPRWRIDLLGMMPEAPAATAAAPALQPTTTEAPRPLALRLALAYERAVVTPMATATPGEHPRWIAMWPALLVIVIAFGSLALAVRLVSSIAATVRTRRCGVPLEDPQWRQRMDHWRARLGIRRHVDLRLTDELNVPVIIGWLRPTILIPKHRMSPSGAHIDSVLLHELCHVRRLDFLWHVLLRAVQVIYWYHPLTWVAGRTITRAREVTCDEVCVHHLDSRDTYRSALLWFAGSLVRRPAESLALAMAKPTRIGVRLDRIAQTNGSPQCVAPWPQRLLAVGVIATVTAVVGSMQFTHAQAFAAQAGDLVQRGYVAAAIDHLDEAALLAPHDASIHAARGDAHARLRRYDLALRDLDRAIRLDASPETFNQRGRTLSRAGRPDRAIHDFDRAITIDPDCDVAFNNRGNALDLLGRIEAALDDYAEAKRLNPSSPVAYNNRARIFHLLERDEEALAEIAAAIKVAPDYAPSYNSRGVIHAQHGDLRRALSDFGRAIELDPQHAEALGNRAHVHARRGEDDAALDDLDRALALEPNLVDALVARGRILRTRGDLNHAAHDLVRAVDLDPRDAAGQLELAHVQFDGGRYEQASQRYGYVLDLDAGHTAALLHRAFCRIYLGRSGAALADLEQLLALEPESAIALAYRGSLLAQTGRSQEAMADFATALERDPALHQAYFFRGRYLLQAGDAAAAARNFDRAIERASIHYYHRWRGVARFELGHDAAARDDLELALAMSPGSTTAQHYLKLVKKRIDQWN